jgi:hypothetical protein
MSEIHRRGLLRASVSSTDARKSRVRRWYIVLIHSMPTCYWAVEDEANAGTRPFDAWTYCQVRTEVWVRPASIFP